VPVSARNPYGQPVGDPVDWAPRAPVGPVTLTGRTCRLEPLGEQHLDKLYAALCVDSPPETWTYLPDGPFDDLAGLAGYVESLLATAGTVPLVVVLPDGDPAGIACFMRPDPANGVVEVGSITMAARIQRTTAATEAMHLMAAHAFDELGYRRYEWKCDALNQPSRRAALRLGFTFEGIFRQAVVYKGRNRDTAWFSITDREWPAVRAAQQRWLEPRNFDERGRQRSPLDAASPMPSAAAP
jgi:RimJ/RimL family protein N-acetyltransferase